MPSDVLKACVPPAPVTRCPLHPPLPQSCLICIPPEETPLQFGTLPSCGQRMLPFALLTLRWLAGVLLLQRRALGGGWQRNARVVCVCG